MISAAELEGAVDMGWSFPKQGNANRVEGSLTAHWQRLWICAEYAIARPTDKSAPRMGATACGTDAKYGIGMIRAQAGLGAQART
jgi:hypothetical protein